MTGCYVDDETWREEANEYFEEVGYGKDDHRRDGERFGDRPESLGGREFVSDVSVRKLRS